MIRLAAVFAALFACVLAVAPAGAQDITVVGLDGKAKVLDAQALAAMPRASVSVARKAGTRVYEGPILSYVLREAGAPSGARMHGPAVRDYVIVTGADGFSGLLSLAEADKDFHEGPVILADKVDGAALDAKHAPYRLVVAGDKMASRSVHGVTKIELRAAP